jgi:hypothetical protein
MQKCLHTTSSSSPKQIVIVHSPLAGERYKPGYDRERKRMYIIVIFTREKFRFLVAFRLNIDGVFIVPTQKKRTMIRRSITPHGPPIQYLGQMYLHNGSQLSLLLFKEASHDRLCKRINYPSPYTREFIGKGTPDISPYQPLPWNEVLHNKS